MAYTRERYNASKRPTWSADDLRAEFDRVQRGIPHPGAVDVRDFGVAPKPSDVADGINRAIQAAAAAGVRYVDIPYSSTAYVVSGLTGASRVTLRGVGGRPTLKMLAGANADIITAADLTEFHVLNLELDGNKANQTGSSLSGDDETVLRKGIFFDTCTRSSIRDCYVHDCRMHGVLVFAGSDNFAEHVECNANGLLSATCFGNGFAVYGSVRFNGRHIAANDNDANSGVSLSFASNDSVLDGIIATGNGASNITINSLRCKLSNFYAEGGVGSSGQGLNVGHASTSTLYADGFTCVNGYLEGNAAAGINVAGCVGGQFSNLRSYNNANYNLLIISTRAHDLKFDNCVFDTTTSTASAPVGNGVYITANGTTPAGHGIEFNNCTSKNARRNGYRVAGTSRVQWIGGEVSDNGAGANSEGIRIEDNASEFCFDCRAVGVRFHDSRSGGSRTQSHSFQSVGTNGDRNRCVAYDSRNHVTTDIPQMGGTNDFHFGMTGGDTMAWGATAAAGSIARNGNVTGHLLIADDGSATAPSHTFTGRTNQGLYSAGANTVGLAAGGEDGIRVDNDATAGNTRLLVFDVDNNTVRRVSVGVADSGGAGFKLLRVPN